MSASNLIDPLTGQLYPQYGGGGGSTGATGAQGATGAGGALGAYLSCGATATQSITSAGSISHFNNLYVDPVGSNLISIVTTSSTNDTINIMSPGIYNIQFSAQFDGPNNNNIYIWLENSSGAIPFTNTTLHTTGGGSPLLASWNWFVKTTTLNEHYRIAWTATSTGITIKSFTNTYGPIIPSIILTVQQVMYTQVGYVPPTTSTWTTTTYPVTINLGVSSNTSFIVYIITAPSTPNSIVITNGVSGGTYKVIIYNKTTSTITRQHTWFSFTGVINVFTFPTSSPQPTNDYWILTITLDLTSSPQRCFINRDVYL